MVRVGIAGVGFMGVTHFKAYASVPEAKVEAIFTRDPAKLAGDWRNVRGNFGDAGGVQDLSGIRRHSELEALLADPEIDLFDLCLPSYLHRDVAIRAMEAGKHVLVEKPVALSVDDADAMLEAARRTGRLLMVGQVLRFWPEFACIRDLMRAGEHGPLLAAHFKRVISRPDWSGDDWFSDPAKTGGAVVDLHIHDTDFVQYLFGPPEFVDSRGLVAPDGQVTYLATEYGYPGRNLCVSAHSGALAQSAVPFEHGYDVYFERAMLRHNSSTNPVVELFAGGERREVAPRIKDAFVEQLQTAVEGVQRCELPPALAAQSARDSLAIVLAEAESARTGRRVVCSV
jgi:predicted dehydrogenase